MHKIKYFDLNGKKVIEEDGKRYDYFNPMNDVIFKTILRNDKKHIIIRTLLKEILGLEIEEILEQDNGFSARGMNKKGEMCDYKVVAYGRCISIECNKKYGNVLLERNVSHLRRMIMDDGFGIVQINIDGYDIGGRNKFIYIYDISDEEGDRLYKDLIKIIHINLSKLDKLLYNDDKFDELSRLEKICAIFLVRERKVLEKLMKGDVELMELKKNIENITNDEDLYDEYTKSEIYGMIEREEGINQRSIEIAKNMIAKNIDFETIMECTGLSKEEIDKLKE